MKSKKKSRITGLIIIGAVIVLPLAYSLFYLGAFWDPYGRLDQLPIAVVNEDSGAVINGKNRNLGNEMTDDLKNDSSLKWTFTDAKTADDGVKGSNYYAVINIPENFSADIASAETTNKQPAQITYSANEKRNYLSSQILTRAFLEIEEKLRSNVNKEITSELVSQLDTVPTQLQELSDGLGKLSDGTLKLKTGTASLVSGQNTLSAGIGSLNSGLDQLYGGAQSLTQNILQLHTGITAIKTGVQASLSATADGGTQAASAAEQIQQLVTGAQKLAAGINKAASGTSELSTAAGSATAGIPALTGGIDKLDSGANQASKGVSSYVDGVNSLITQNQTLAAKLAAVYSSAAMTDAQKVAAVGQILSGLSSKDTQKQLQTLTAAGTSIKDGTAAVAAGADQLKASEGNLASLQSNLGSLGTSMQQLSAGAAQVASGVGQLQEKSSDMIKMAAGLDTISASLDKLDTGAQQLYTGAQSLTDGIGSAKSGSSQLTSGIAQLQDGTSELQTGVKDLSDGTVTAKTSVDQAIQTADSDLKQTDGLADFAANPVTIKAEPINPVPNYGTAFSPYFMSLSLYVGAIIMFVGIYLDQDEKIRMLSRDSGRRFVRIGVFAAIGVVQAVILALIAKYGLGLQVANPAAYYLSCILTSLVFISIVEFFIVCLKDAGKFLALLFLILQLTSCGGTFPMELVPKFFKVLYPFMPMTYSVNLFKEAISGYDSASAMTSALILAAIGITFTVLTMIFSAAHRFKLRQNEDILRLADDKI
jgi:putative membrane protein